MSGFKNLVLELWAWASVPLVIIFGAFVHATVQLKLARDTNDDSFTFLDWLILLPISAFSGWVFYLMASAFFQDDRLIGGAAGMGAFVGIRGLNFIATVGMKFIKKKLGVNDEDGKK